MTDAVVQLAMCLCQIRKHLGPFGGRRQTTYFVIWVEELVQMGTIYVVNYRG